MNRVKFDFCLSVMQLLASSCAANALKLLLDNAPHSMTAGLTDWTIDTSHDKNILFYKGKQYIPRNAELHQEIVKLFHDHETA